MENRDDKVVARYMEAGKQLILLFEEQKKIAVENAVKASQEDLRKAYAAENPQRPSFWKIALGVLLGNLLGIDREFMNFSPSTRELSDEDVLKLRVSLVSKTKECFEDTVDFINNAMNKTKTDEACMEMWCQGLDALQEGSTQIDEMLEILSSECNLYLRSGVRRLMKDVREDEEFNQKVRRRVSNVLKTGN